LATKRVTPKPSRSLGFGVSGSTWP
jgi:hypothetical protein